jgi:hypothetical protein
LVELFDFVPLKGTISELPKADLPHYVPAAEGLYLRKPTIFGPCMLPQTSWPDHLAKMGDYKKGMFTFEGTKVSPQIMAKAVDFFKKVNKKYGTEAEVIILWEPKKKEYDLFIPYQACTGVSVNSIYDPADIPLGWMVVGTMHSHCDMGAFHSGTDEADAKTFNGLHITVGTLSTEPEFVAMMMVNKVDFHFDIEVVADISELDSAICPNIWFDNLFKSKREIIEKRTFKSLSKEALDDFLWESVFVSNNGKKKDSKPKGYSLIPYRSYNNDDDLDMEDYWKDYKDRAHYSSNGNFNTRWSVDFHKQLPQEVFDDWGHIRKEDFQEVLREELERLFLLAVDYDIYLDYKQTVMSSSK